MAPPFLNFIRSQIYPHWRVAWPLEWASISADLAAAGRSLDIPLPAPEPELERRAFLAKAIHVDPAGTEADFVSLAAAWRPAQ